MDEKILSLAIIIIALIFSAGTTAISLRLQTNARRRSIREQLSNLMQDISRTLDENILIWATPSDQRDAIFHQKLGSIVRRFETLCHQALHLLREDPTIAHHADYAILAQALLTSNNSPKAEECWNKAIEIAPTDFDKLSNMRTYADFLFQQGKHEQGRAMYQKAVEILANDKDFNKFTNAYTHQMHRLRDGLRDVPFAACGLRDVP